MPHRARSTWQQVKDRYGTLAILRQTESFAERDYDLIVVGGGIYGVMLALESVKRGLRPLLLEKDDFGAATSFNSLRIVHGGLRHLQTLDLRRHLESVQERRWFLANFSEFVVPLPCLMPLYGRGIRRKSIFRAALLINDVLSANRNDGVAAENAIPGGRVYDKSGTIKAFPDVNQDGLQGAAVWYDAAVPDSQRVVMEVLRWASHYGADAANYTRALKLIVSGDQVRGVVARDRETNSEISFRARVVINSGGPWSQEIAGQFGSVRDSWFWPSLAWNLLTDKPALSKYALAITPLRAGGPTYFLHPWKGRLFVGTGHSAWEGPLDNPRPSSEQTWEMIDDLNSAIPGLGLGKENISRVVAGLLPATGPRSPNIATRPAIVDHSKCGGPGGLVSICGVKFTTARLVAAKTLDSVFGRTKGAANPGFQRPRPAPSWQSESVDFSDEKAEASYGKALGKLITEESAMNLCDVVFRRTDLWERPQLALRLAPKIGEFFDWSDDRKTLELKKLEQELAQSELRHSMVRES